MWLFTKQGFMSIVKHREQEGKLLIRFRCKEDAQEMRRFLREKNVNVKIKKTKNADYRYRIVIDQETFMFMVAVMVGMIDYDNFKNAVHGDPDRDIAYMNVWGDMMDLQCKKEGSYRDLESYLQTEDLEDRGGEPVGDPLPGDDPRSTE